eukprot:Colp12_sorted_trinity150504_noHs@16036
MHLVSHRSAVEVSVIVPGVGVDQSGTHGPRAVLRGGQSPPLPHRRGATGGLHIHGQLTLAELVGNVHQRTHGHSVHGEHDLCHGAVGLVHDRHLGLSVRESGAEQSLQRVRVGDKLHQHVPRGDGEQTHGRVEVRSAAGKVRDDQLLVEGGVLEAGEVVDEREVAVVRGVERGRVHVPHVRQGVKLGGSDGVGSLVDDEVAEHAAVGGGHLDAVQSVLRGGELQVEEGVRHVVPGVVGAQVAVQLEEHGSGSIHGEGDDVDVARVGIRGHLHVREGEREAGSVLTEGHSRGNVVLLDDTLAVDILASHRKIVSNSASTDGSSKTQHDKCG